MNRKFADLGVTAPLLGALEQAGITAPTEIQCAAIPKILAGRDVVGQSPTGTGKTLAYLLPLLQKVAADKREIQVVILTPTYELAMQIFRQIEALVQAAGLPFAATPLIGQANMARQIERLKEKPQIVVGSAGRILELIQKRKIAAQTVKTIVLDEADRLLEDAHQTSVRAVIRATLKDRQLLLFSATLPPAALKRAKELTPLAEQVAVAGGAKLPDAITHLWLMAERRDKLELLRKLAAANRIDQGLVFVNNGGDIPIAVDKLNYHGLNAAGLSGSEDKTTRQKALAAFRSGKIRLLVATDLAARGLDIPGIDWVINLELPDTPDIYLHRTGRTGRAGKPGTAVSLVTPREAEQLKVFAKRLGIDIAARQLQQGAMTDAPPRERTRRITKQGLPR